MDRSTLAGRVLPTAWNGEKPRRARVVVVLMVTLIFTTAAIGAGFSIFQAFPDDSGLVQAKPGHRNLNAHNKFFDPAVGTNGQACVTCHEPEQGFTVHVDNIVAAFTASQGLDPLFRVVDSADRPDAPTGTLAERQAAYNLVQTLGVFRIGKTVPAVADFKIEQQDTGQFGPLPTLNDPQHPGVLTLSAFRRPLVNLNVRFDSSVLWDGRASITDMDTQVKGAIQTLLLAPGNPPVDNPKTDHEIAAFMTGVFVDQVFDNAAGTDANGDCALPNGAICGSGSTSAKGARGGINNLLRLAFSPHAPCLFAVASPGPPPVFELTPLTPFTCRKNVPGYDLFRAWEKIRPDAEDRREHESFDKDDGLNAGRASVARGERLFNRANLRVPADLQGQFGTKDIHCTTCHATRNIGNNPDPTFFARIGTDSVDIMTDLAIHDNRVQELLDRVKTLPLYCVRPASDTTDFATSACGNDPGDVKTTDPGRSLVSGKIADIGKFKPPVLRGLAARSPYFHNAAAPNIQALVHFYNARFQIGLSEADVNDLGAFLEDQ
jgi:cytochrome c peroxidase